MSRPRVTDLFLQDVHKSQLQDRLQTVQVEERWIVGAEAAEQQRAREQWNRRRMVYSDVRT